MGKFLTKKQIEELRFCHQVEDKLRYGDRIKAVLLLDAGWTQKKISEALLLDEGTIRNYKKLYDEGGADRLCCDNLYGSSCNLTEEEQQTLKQHLSENLYSTTAEIVDHIKASFDVIYSLSGATNLLHRLGFSYKKTKIVPGKADADKQREFLEKLEELKSTADKALKFYYLDGVHPQHNSQAGYGWILKGEEKEIKSNTGRKRININGALDSETNQVIYREDETLNAESTIKLLEEIEAQNPDIEVIYCIVDNARYYKNKTVKEFLETSKIELLFLPSYSPNLNLIERLWKFFRKIVLYNKYYESFDEFKKTSMEFFQDVNDNRFNKELRSLLTHNFQIIGA